MTCIFCNGPTESRKEKVLKKINGKLEIIEVSADFCHKCKKKIYPPEYSHLIIDTFNMETTDEIMRELRGHYE